jgi:hypothetical protein
VKQQEKKIMSVSLAPLCGAAGFLAVARPTIQAVTQGQCPDGSRLGPPMAFAYYRNLHTDDLSDLVAYLRSLKPISNAVK